MITIDYSQISAAAAMAFSADYAKGADTKKMAGISRHVILGSIMNYKRQYQNKYGQVVICCDGRNYWRRSKFQYYKAHRAGAREESAIDWKSVFSIASEVREELQAFFPWKVILVDEAEGDDVIAVLTKYTQDNEFVQDGLEESPQLVMNISSDHDFRQLYKYRNYSQFSPIQKKVVPRADKTFLIDKIIRGDGGDGIPSIKCPDDFYVAGEKKRAPPIRQTWVDAIIAKPDGSTLTTEERRNYARNKMLIDFESIPDEIESKIISAYHASIPSGTQQLVFDYCIKHRLKQHMADIPAFFK